MRSRTDDSAGPTLAHRLGWYGIALGITELAFPRLLAKAIGVEADRRSATVLRAMGARELAAGVAVLIQPQRPAPLWGRLAGDVLDLALLGVAAIVKRTSGARLAGAAAAVAGGAALDAIAGRRSQRAYAAANRPVIDAITINRPPQVVYDFYRELGQLPRFMDWLERVEEIDDRRSHWVARVPLGVATVEWDAEIVENRPGEVISWRSVDGSRVQTAGRILFTRTPGRDMTEVRVELQLGFTGIHPSAPLAKFFAQSQIRGDLLRLKQVLETGEVLRSEPGPQPAPRQGAPVLMSHQPTVEEGLTP